MHYPRCGHVNFPIHGTTGLLCNRPDNEKPASKTSKSIERTPFRIEQTANPHWPRKRTTRKLLGKTPVSAHVSKKINQHSPDPIISKPR